MNSNDKNKIWRSVVDNQKFSDTTRKKKLFQTIDEINESIAKHREWLNNHKQEEIELLKCQLFKRIRIPQLNMNISLSDVSIITIKDIEKGYKVSIRLKSNQTINVINSHRYLRNLFNYKELEI